MFKKKAAISFISVLTIAATFLSGCGSTGKSTVASPAPGKEGAKQPVEINFYFTGSQNVKDLWDALLPAFEKQNTGVKVKPVYIPSGTGAQPTIDRILAAKQAGKGSGDIDLYEDGLPFVTRGQKDDLWDTLSADKISNLSKVDQTIMKDISSAAIPYRSSAVILAYNSDKVKDVPNTLDELYDWIRKHPQKFAYNDPSTGGAGSSFVTTTVYKSLPADAIHNSDASVTKQWDQGFATLKDLGKYVYGKGVYPKKNQGTLDLMTSGEVDMITAWSDMVMDQMDKGQLPKSTKMKQLQPGFNGGPTYLMVPKLSEKKEAVYKFLNFVLSPEAQGIVVEKMHGFPGIQLSNMPKEIQDSFKGASEGFRSFNIGELDKEINKRWQSDVAAQ